eukprot:163634_1
MSVAPESYIECQCGEVRIGLEQPAHCKFAIGCCCEDCYQRVLIAASNNKVIHRQMQDSIHYKKAVDLVFLPNALIVSNNTKQLLQFEKLRVDGANVHCVAKCCGTMLFGANPLLKGQSIWCQVDGPKMAGVTLMDQQIIAFGKDWVKDKYDAFVKGKEAKLLPDPMSNPSVMGPFVMAVQAETSKTEEAVRYEELYTENDIVFNNDFFKESRKPTYSN